MSLLEVNGLCVSFGRRRVVDQVSFTLERGEKLALVGESGSGKTVTALATIRLHHGARLEGGIRFEGRDVLAMGPDDLQALRGGEIAVIFQEPMTALNPVMTVGAQIGEALQIHKGLSGQPARQQAIAALRRVGVPEPERRVDSFPH
ncbi:MAG TPA: ATP-binding cassette domain-containing protein, partial [bacterium]|nr:ATP-binding cassette domain-containing protein [bacterium]